MDLKIEENAPSSITTVHSLYCKMDPDHDSQNSCIMHAMDLKAQRQKGPLSHIKSNFK